MYSLSVRFNKIFFYGCINLAILCTVNYLTGVYQVKDKKIDTEFKFMNHYYFQPFRKRISSSVTADWEVLLSSFSLKVKNLKNIETWNLKQLFFYLEMVWDEKGKKQVKQKLSNILGQNYATQQTKRFQYKKIKIQIFYI